eukprot:UN06239
MSANLVCCILSLQLINSGYDLKIMIKSGYNVLFKFIGYLSIFGSIHQIDYKKSIQMEFIHDLILIQSKDWRNDGQKSTENMLRQ